MQFSGHTITGEGRGRKIGFPTVNVELHVGDAYMRPSQNHEGVFAVRGKIFTSEGHPPTGDPFEGIVHIGPRPTFDSFDMSVEIHIFSSRDAIHRVSFSDIPENSPIEFDIIGEKIRDVKKFDSEEELKKQITKDCEGAKEILKKSHN
ncbi:riboflavin kinase [Candidatus Peregrinibacteria bacterium]|nr:riboflavin kinase [Candidatus Peregrinibacteria bacterium]